MYLIDRSNLLKQSCYGFAFVVLLSSDLMSFDPMSVDVLYSEQVCCHRLDLTKPIRLYDAVSMAICSNPESRIAISGVKYQLSQVGSTRASYLPTVSLSGNLGNSFAKTNNFTRDGSVAIGYTLYDFGVRDAKNKIAIENFEVASASKDVLLQNIFLQTVKFFYQTLSDKNAVEVALENEKYALASYDAANKRYEVGISTSSDKLQAKTALSNSTLALIKAQGQYKTSMAELVNILGASATQAILLDDSYVDLKLYNVVIDDLEKLVELALKDRSEVAESNHSVLIAKESERLSRLEYLPLFSISGASGYDASGGFASKRSSSLFLNFSMPIFTGFSSLYSLKAAKEKVNMAMLQKQKQEAAIGLEVVKAYHALKTQIKSLEASNDLIASSKASYDMAFGRYKAGVGSILELLNAQSAMAEAKKLKISTYYDLQIANITLARTVGQINLEKIQKTDR